MDEGSQKRFLLCDFCRERQKRSEGDFDILLAIDEKREVGLQRERDGLLGFGYAVGASAQGPKVIGGVERLMPVDPCDEHPALAEARKLAQPLTRFGNRSGDLALAQVTGARAPQIFQRKNTVVAIVPHDADGMVDGHRRPRSQAARQVRK